MYLVDFKCLKGFSCENPILLTKGADYATLIYNANIPYRPGVYLVYSLNELGEDSDLLYYGKAGVTNNNGTPHLNFHQLPKRLVATTPIPLGHPDYKAKVKTDITRAKLWPWYVKNKFTDGIKIYWFTCDWPRQNPYNIELQIKEELKNHNPNWKKRI